MRDFAGKTALITGAGGGIGRALALAAAARSMHVVACDIDAAPLDSLLVEARAAGAASASARALDVRDAHAFATLASECGPSYGGIDVLFCNAGVIVPRRLWEQTAREFDWLLDVNVKGVVNGIRACVPAMLQRGTPAHVVITGSMGGFIPSPLLGAYSASKAALCSLAETLCLDLAASGAKIGVSLLAPGAVRSNLFDVDRHQAAGAAPLEGAAAAVRDAMVAGTARVGMDPARVAELTFAAIEAERFWVFPHPEMLAALPERQAAMLEGRTPSFEFEKSFRPPAAR
jgi:NAD(P)-dependent dehydrogenase (short-subunit alcohol dehydrogenase family)